jgi:hypothetical protein
VHDIQDHIGNRFWAHPEVESSDDDLEMIVGADKVVESGVEPKKGFSLGGLANSAGVSLAELSSAALDLDGPATRKVIDVLAAKLVKSRGVKPWVGPLPLPRLSPPRTLGDALGSATVAKPRRATRGQQWGRQPPLGMMIRHNSKGQRVGRQLGAHGNPSGRPCKPSFSPRLDPKQMDGGPVNTTGANFGPSGGDWNRLNLPEGRNCVACLLPRFAVICSRLGTRVSHFPTPRSRSLVLAATSFSFADVLRGGMEKGDDTRGNGKDEPPRGSSQGNAMGRGRFAPLRGGFHPSRGGFGARGGFRNRFQGNSKTWNRFGGGRGGSGPGQEPSGDVVPLRASSRRGEEVLQGQAGLGLVAGSMAAELHTSSPNKGDAIEVDLLHQVVTSLQEAKKDGKSDVSLAELLRAMLEKVEDKGKSLITFETSSLVEPTMGHGASQISGGVVAEVPEGSNKGGSRKNEAKAYCHRCRSKGHYLADCKEEFLCEVCDSVDHPKSRCLVFNHLKQRPGCIYFSGFAAVGLGFFPYSSDCQESGKEGGPRCVDQSYRRRAYCGGSYCRTKAPNTWDIGLEGANGSV